MAIYDNDYEVIWFNGIAYSHDDDDNEEDIEQMENGFAERTTLKYFYPTRYDQNLGERVLDKTTTPIFVEEECSGYRDEDDDDEEYEWNAWNYRSFSYNDDELDVEEDDLPEEVIDALRFD
jgi:hypothetical protein